MTSYKIRAESYHRKSIYVCEFILTSSQNFLFLHKQNMRIKQNVLEIYLVPLAEDSSIFLNFSTTDLGTFTYQNKVVDSTLRKVCIKHSLAILYIKFLLIPFSFWFIGLYMAAVKSNRPYNSPSNGLSAFTSAFTIHHLRCLH